MNKPVYLGLSISEIRKIVMYKFWYDYVKPKYGEKAKLCYTDTNSFMLHGYKQFCRNITHLRRHCKRR